MKMNILILIVAFIAPLTFAGAQTTYTENVDNISNTAGYHDGTYNGENAFVWTYVKGRSTTAGGGNVINGINSIMINAGWGSIESPVIEDGISNITFKARQSFSKLENDRDLKVQIWDGTKETKLKTVDLVYKGIASEGDMTLQEFSVPNLDITGSCKFLIINASSVAKSEISIDDIEWTTNPTSTNITSSTKDAVAKVYSDHGHIKVEQKIIGNGVLEVYSLAGQLVHKTHTQLGINNISFSGKGVFIVRYSLGDHINSVKLSLN